MKTYRYLSIVALALMGAMIVGCSKSDINESEQSENGDNIVTLTTTIGFDEGDEATKALTSGGVKTFAEGDQIAVVYTNTGNSTARSLSNALTSNNIASNRRRAGFTMTLTNPKVGGSVKYIYPASMAKEDGSINYDALYSNQDGTLVSLASTFDLAVYEGTMTQNAELPSGECTLSNRLAILAITLKNKGGSTEITSSITNLTITDGTYTYAVTRTAAAGPIYVAIRPTSSASITIMASDGTNGYNKTLSSKTYEAGKIYNVTWRMTETTLGQVICTDRSIYSSVSAATSAGKNAVAMIVYLGSSTGNSKYTNGLALALSDEGLKKWEDAKTVAAAHTPTVSGASWMLASKAQWTTMISAAGSYTALRDGFSSVGGTNMPSGRYWASTEYSSSDAWFYYFSDGNWYYTGKTAYRNVRACLAF